MIVRVRVVFKKKVLIVDYLSGRHPQSQVKSLPQMMVFMPLVMVLIGQFCHDVIGWLVVVLLSLLIHLLFVVEVKLHVVM